MDNLNINKIQRKAEKCREMQRNEEKCKEMQRNVDMYPHDLHDTWECHI